MMVEYFKKIKIRDAKKMRDDLDRKKSMRDAQFKVKLKEKDANIQIEKTDETRCKIKYFFF